MFITMDNEIRTHGESLPDVFEETAKQDTESHGINHSQQARASLDDHSVCQLVTDR